MRKKGNKQAEQDYNELFDLYNSQNFIEFSNSCVQISISNGTQELEQNPQQVTENYMLGLHSSIAIQDDILPADNITQYSLFESYNNQPKNNLNQLLDQFSRKLQNNHDYGYSLSETNSKMDNVSLPSVSTTINSTMSQNFESQLSFATFDAQIEQMNNNNKSVQESKLQKRTVKSQKDATHNEELQILQNIIFAKLYDFFRQVQPNFQCNSFKEMMIYRNKYLAVTKSNINLNWKEIVQIMQQQSPRLEPYTEKSLYTMFLAIQRRALDSWTAQEIQNIKHDVKRLFFVNNIRDKSVLKANLEEKYHFTEQYHKNLKQIMDVIDQQFRIFKSRE